jgi:hypothetical protein
MRVTRHPAYLHHPHTVTLAHLTYHPILLVWAGAYGRSSRPAASVLRRWRRGGGLRRVRRGGGDDDDDDALARPFLTQPGLFLFCLAGQNQLFS